MSDPDLELRTFIVRMRKCRVCGLSLATMESAGRGSFSGVTAIKHTEMTRSYVLKRPLADEACRNVF